MQLFGNYENNVRIILLGILSGDTVEKMFSDFEVGAVCAQYRFLVLITKEFLPNILL
jgi:hypothetical protein